MIDNFGDKIDSITLVRVANGRFEVTTDGKTVFSKAEEHRHAQQGEVVQRIRQMVPSLNPGRDVHVPM